jgi:hypothetical protein
VAFFAFELSAAQHYLTPRAGWQAPLPPRRQPANNQNRRNAMRQFASHVLVFLASVAISGTMLSAAVA